jgi:hypothetical protein
MDEDRDRSARATRGDRALVAGYIRELTKTAQPAGYLPPQLRVPHLPDDFRLLSGST